MDGVRVAAGTKIGASEGRRRFRIRVADQISIGVAVGRPGATTGKGVFQTEVVPDLVGQGSALVIRRADRGVATERSPIDNDTVEALPGNLWEAIQVAESSKLVRESLGDQVFRSFIENKKIEWESYHSQVTNYEIRRYLPVL